MYIYSHCIWQFMVIVVRDGGYFTVWIVNKRRKESEKFNFKLCKCYKKNYWYHQFWFCFSVDPLHTKRSFVSRFVCAANLIIVYAYPSESWLSPHYTFSPFVYLFFLLCTCHSCFLPTNSVGQVWVAGISFHLYFYGFCSRNKQSY